MYCNLIPIPYSILIQIPSGTYGKPCVCYLCLTAFKHIKTTIHLNRGYCSMTVSQDRKAHRREFPLDFNFDFDNNYIHSFFCLLEHFGQGCPLYSVVPHCEQTPVAFGVCGSTSPTPSCSATCFGFFCASFKLPIFLIFTIFTNSIIHSILYICRYNLFQWIYDIRSHHAIHQKWSINLNLWNKHDFMLSS